MSAKRAVRTKQTQRTAARRRDPFARDVARAVRRRRVLIALGLVAVHLLFAALSFLPAPHTGGDNAAYLALARSLTERHAYLEIYDPAAPPHTQYPPVYPGILAVALAAGLQPWAHIKALVAVFSAGAVAFTFLWGVRRRRPLLALGVGTLLAVSPGVLELSHWELSDVPFWFFTVLALWGWERLGPREHGRLAIAIVATALAYFTRSAGLPLLLAALAWLALRRRWMQLAALAGVVLPLALLWWLRAQAQGGVDYVEQFWLVNPYDPLQGRAGITDLFRRALDNQSKYASIHLPMLLADAQGPLLTMLAALVTLLALYGWVCRLRRPAVAELFLPLYVGLLFVWPAVWSGERFLLPVFGMFLLYAGDGIVRVARIMRVRQPALIGAVAAAALLVFAIPGIATQVQVGQQCRIFGSIGDRYPCMSEPWRDFFQAAEWTRAGLPADAVVISRKPRLFWALSGRPSRIFPFDTVPGLFFDAAEDAGARYLLLDGVDGLSRVYVTPILARRTQAFCLMRVQPRTGTAVFGILADARDAPAAPPDSTSRDVPFRACPAEYFGNPADRDALMRGMAAAPGGGR